MEFFGTIYCWFERMFGQDLAEHMWGWDGAIQDYVKPDLFVPVGIIALATALFVAVLYYYIINHPRFNRAWSWLIMLAIVVVANLFIGHYFPYRDFIFGEISNDLNVSDINCWMFGVANMIVSGAFFIIFSFAIKWWSRNAKYSPF